MKEKFINIRIEREAYDNFKLKSDKISKVVQELTRKETKISIPHVISMASKKPLFIGDDEILKELKRKNKI